MTKQYKQYQTTGNMLDVNDLLVDPRWAPVATMAIDKQGGIVGTGLFNG